MGKISSMKDVRIIATPYMQLCKKCGHTGIQHMEKDHHDSSRQNKKLGKLVKCTMCNCKKFIPPKEK